MDYVLETTMQNPTPPTGARTADNNVLSHKATALNAPGRAQADTHTIQLALRSRKVVRMAPPIDDGFRPFRVF
jgi:hypothetical protein